MKAETVLKNKILKGLRTIPESRWFNIQQVAIRGDPDIIGLIRGKFYGIEVKLKFEERLDSRERLQRRKLRQIADAGGAMLIITKDTWKFHVKRLGGEVK